MCQVFDKPDAALDEALDDVERNVNADLNKMAARDAMFPELVKMIYDAALEMTIYDKHGHMAEMRRKMEIVWTRASKLL